MTYSKLRIAVTGRQGQLVNALSAHPSDNTKIIPLGRPQLDLSNKKSVFDALRHAHCDVIINSAAYTTVDKAETEPEVARQINGIGAGYVAEIAAELAIPLLQISTDYVFDGVLDRPYHESDTTNPRTSYGRSKLLGETLVSEYYANHVILRTAWVYSEFGTNFVKTMLNIGETRNRIGVVADQIGNPTYASDIADGLIRIANRLVSDPDPSLRGIFHMTGKGVASWAELAEAIFEIATIYGREPVHVHRLGTAEYPTLALRPSNSRLNNEKIQNTYGIFLPDWRQSLETCVRNFLRK